MNSKEFFASDYSSTLYPLKTNRLMVEHHSAESSDYIFQKVLNVNQVGDNFLPQQRVYATKPNGHLRRTFKLDPVAEYFIYDLTYRNREIFRPAVSSSRLSFGYRFEKGIHIPVNKAYREYKSALAVAAKKFKHSIQFDIASYFNSIYHHDLAHWFCGKTDADGVDCQAFGQFIREINAGRSIDVLPQGIYPCKMLGNEFLKLVDLSSFLKSAQLIRFMDDFVLFDDSEHILRQDFIKIQQILGQYALNINPSKTFYNAKVGDLSETLGKIKASLSEIIQDYEPVFGVSSVEFVVVGEIEIENSLDETQISNLIDLLKNDDTEESDADQILAFLRTHSESVLEVIPELLTRFPNLIKHIHAVCADVEDKAELNNILRTYLEKQDYYLEYQLFWIAEIIEDYLLGHVDCGASIIRIFELTSDYKIARAKILEIPTDSYGLKEQRSEYLKTGQSDWLSWSAAMGSRSLLTAERNHVLNYFAKASPLNHLVGECVKKL